MRIPLILLILAATGLGAAERINHAGRILGPEPVVSTPLLFNTAQADAVVAAMQIMPRDNPWNEVVSGLPVHASSAVIMAQIRADLVAVSSSRNTLRVFPEMNYALVPTTQPLADLLVTDYPDEADLNGGTSPVARYPIPANWPIEGWPSGRPGETLSHAQTTDDGSDRHAIAVSPGTGRIFETWRTVLTAGSPAWQASGGAMFPLDSNDLRPDGWTSADAAGLPMFPALIRYDECERGEIEHALRIVVNKSRRSYVYPATHYASSLTATAYPPMGLRIRLKQSFAIPGSWSQQSRAVARALQTYGALVADNGGFFSVSACPDDRFPAGCFDDVQTIDINQFEAVASTGASEGPRSAGAPTVAAGADQTVALADGAALLATASGSGLTHAWYLYDAANAPGTATFSAPAALATSVSFSAAGTYTLMIRSSDGVHTPAYDAVVITVTTVPAGTPPVLGAVAASPATVGGTTTAVSASASDDGGAANLRYTWQASGPAAVVFSPNGGNAAQAATATFSAAGSYTLTVTVADSGNQSVQGSVAVTVAQTATTLAVTPSSAVVAPGGSQLFTVVRRDQFGAAMSAPPSPSWGVSGGGTIAADGTFQAGQTVGGPYTVTVQAGGLSASAALLVQAAPAGQQSSSGGSGEGGGCGAGALASLVLLAGFALFARRR